MNLPPLPTQDRIPEPLCNVAGCSSLATVTQLIGRPQHRCALHESSGAPVIARAKVVS